MLSRSLLGPRYSTGSKRRLAHALAAGKGHSTKIVFTRLIIRPASTAIIGQDQSHRKSTPTKGDVLTKQVACHVTVHRPATMSAPIEVLLYGLGAIGSFYAFILQRNPRVRLSVCARSNYDAVKANGVTIRSKNHGDHMFLPVKVLRSPDEAQQTYDYIVCVNKAVNTDAVLKQLVPVVDEKKTTIVLTQNGVGNEDPFREAFPGCTIVSGVVWVGATQHTPGVVDHQASEDTELGLFSNPMLDFVLEQQRLEDFASLLRDGGTNVQVLENIQTARWKKVIWNLAWNTLTTLTGADVESWLNSSDIAIPITHRLMTEAIEVARALGVPGIEYELADQLIAKVRPMGPLYSSMYHDSRAARPMELEVIVGTPVRKGRELGIAIPTLEIIYAMLLAMDERLAKERASQ